MVIFYSYVKLPEGNMSQFFNISEVGVPTGHFSFLAVHQIFCAGGYRGALGHLSRATQPGKLDQLPSTDVAHRRPAFFQ